MCIPQALLCLALVIIGVPACLWLVVRFQGRPQDQREETTRRWTEQDARRLWDALNQVDQVPLDYPTPISGASRGEAGGAGNMRAGRGGTLARSHNLANRL